MRIILTILLLAQGMLGFSQVSGFSKINIDRSFQDTLTFVKQWDYHPKVYKTDSGLYYTSGEGLARQVDTGHLFYTADLHLNDYGSEIHYAFASRSGDTLLLKFGQSDPIFLQRLQFRLSVVGQQFRVDSIEMPLRSYLRKIVVYRVLSQKLILPQLLLPTDSFVYGYVELTIQQILPISDDDIRTYNYFVKGYFKIPVLEYNR